MNKISARTLAIYGMFIAVILILGLTPVGFIYLPIACITTVHVPVIVGGYSLGKKGGALLGFLFGLTSLIRCFTTPDATSAIVLGTGTGFGIYNLLLILLVIFLPRILTGFFAASVYGALSEKNDMLAMGASAFAGSMTNTVLYLGGLYILANEQTAAAMGVAVPTLLKTLLGIVALNGVLEAVAAVLISTAVGKALSAYMHRR